MVASRQNLMRVAGAAVLLFVAALAPSNLSKVFWDGFLLALLLLIVLGVVAAVQSLRARTS